jgi:glycosyltransferase involved in cell wall biosynthesis
MNYVGRVTAVIPAKNEEHQIAEAIRSAFLLADSVLVIDDDSQDGTARVAIEQGAKVIKGCEHGGFIDKLFHFGFAQVDDGWILRLDADERVTEGLARELRKVMAEGKFVGASFARLHYMFGAPVFFGGWFKPFQVGFFRADSWDRSWKAGLHSQVPLKGETRVIPPALGHTIHYDYETIEQFIQRSLVSYARSEAAQKFEAGLRFKSGDLLIKPWVKFFGRFFVRKGYKDGERGMVLAALLAAYEIAVACFLWQLSKKEKISSHSKK